MDGNSYLERLSMRTRLAFCTRLCGCETWPANESEAQRLLARLEERLAQTEDVGFSSLPPAMRTALDLNDPTRQTQTAIEHLSHLRSQPGSVDAVLGDRVLPQLRSDPQLQERLARLVNYPPSRWLLEQELPVIRQARALRRTKAAAKAAVEEGATPGPAAPGDQVAPAMSEEPLEDAYRWAHTNHLAGLCFSGGGIRSATFNLGVLQGLAQRGQLGTFDYLSSVSGGGYLHQWLAAWIKRQGSVQAVEQELIPQPEVGCMPAHPHTIRWLRRYSNYLTPQRGVFTADTWVALAIWIRNTFLNQIILVSGLFCMVLLAHLFDLRLVATVLTAGTASVARHSSPYELLVLVELAVIVISSFFAMGVMAINLRAQRCHLKPPEKRSRWQSKLADWICGSLLRSPTEPMDEVAIQLLVLAPLLLASLAGTQLLIMKDKFAPCFLPDFIRAALHLPAYPLPTMAIVVFALLFLLNYTILVAGGAVETYRISNGDKYIHWARTYFFCFVLLAAAAGTGYFYAVRYAILVTLPRLLPAAIYAHDAWRLALVFGPPMLLLVPFFSIVVGSGLVGHDYPDWLREWLARVRAWSLLHGLSWTLYFGFALLGSGVVDWMLIPHHFGYSLRWPALLSWIATTAGGVFSGNSAKTHGDGKQAESDSSSSKVTPLLNLFAVAAPYVFLAGLFLLLSYTAEYALLWAHRSYNSGWLTFLIYALPAGICLLFGARVDINEFSMHAFYRNRLIRCYLGASNLTRRPNPLTGFDERDFAGLALSEFLPGKYDGPFPIFCTALNLTFGEDLAWQERKAASFAFTPLYSGYYVGWTAGRAESKVSFNGFVPTALFAYPQGGINIGTAAAISGAAMSPNWGYHTNPATAFLMTMFNVRLGWWLCNPRTSKLHALEAVPPDAQTKADTPSIPSRAPVDHATPRFAPAQLVKELLGMVDDTSKYVYLTDGGHFDNLGLYELVRRRCYRIVICDSEGDPELSFNGIGAAIRKCRLDFGAEITLDLKPLQRDPKTGFSSEHALWGEIRYPETPAGERGQVLYIKSSLVGDEPGDILNYALEHGAFPHDSTLNQWFTESQFESYRRLGLHIVNTVYSD